MRIVILLTWKVTLARFFFLDQSLKGVGGHHFDYAVHVLRAAKAAGFETFLGAHRRFREQRSLPRDCVVDNVFRHTVYNRFSSHSRKKLRNDQTAEPRMSSSAEDSRHSFKAWRDRWSGIAFERGRKRVVQHFREDCASLFGDRAHQFGDEVFLATISDVELLGLAEYARHEPTSRLATWHCQFHFNIFQGRPHEYGDQDDALQRCRARFQDAFAALRDHRVFFYTTSDELADQYRRLDLADFQSLAYPVNPRLSISRTPRRIQSKHERTDSQIAFGEPSNRPLRVTLAGAVRKEKGQFELDQLVRRIGPTLLQSKSATMVIQRKRRSRFRRQQVDLTEALRQVGVDASSCLEYVEHPLQNGGYETLMQQADVGLFLYDGRTYYARRAGVLGEFLSLGVPVIVPAGCWLSQQIRTVNEQYHDTLICDGVAQPLELQSSLRSDALIDTTRQDPIQLKLQLPPNCHQLLIRARVKLTNGEPSFLSCSLQGSHPVVNPSQEKQWRSEPGKLEPFTDRLSAETTAGCLSSSLDSSPCSTLIALPVPKASEIDLKLSPAFGALSVGLQDLEVYSICQSEVPLGVVGLAALSRDHVPALLEELLKHYHHYRNSAVDFATQWYAAHDPKEVIRQLMQRNYASRQAA